MVFLGMHATRLQAQNNNQIPSSLKSKLASIDDSIRAKKYAIAKIMLLRLTKEKKQTDNKLVILAVNLRKAKLLYKKGNQKEAMKLLLDGTDLLNKLQQPFLQAKYSTYLGRIFEAAKNYPKAIEYYKKSVDLSLQLKDTLIILRTYSRLGRIYFRSKKIDSASYYYKKVINFKNLIRSQHRKQQYQVISRAYASLVAILIRQNGFPQAEYYANETINLNKTIKDSFSTSLALTNLGTIYLYQKKYKQAKSTYKEAYMYVQKDSSKIGLKQKEDVLYNLAYVSNEVKDYKSAYNYLSKSSDINADLSAKNLAENISEIEAKYNVAKTEKEAALEKAKRLKTQVWFYSSIVFTLIIIILGFIFYKNYQLKQENKIDRLLNQTQTKILNATIDAKELERRNIAAILHDSVSALLSAANMHLQASKIQLKKNAPLEITKAQDIVSEASIKIRDLSHELVSSVLLKFGLAFAVNDICQKCSNSQIDIYSNDDGIKRYDQNFEIKIYNIIEELINNMLKHSKAHNASVLLYHKEHNILEIILQDDGIGFDVKKAKNKDGLGLSHIEARITMMKGKFIITSAKNQGSKFFISVPIKLKEAVA